MIRQFHKNTYLKMLTDFLNLSILNIELLGIKTIENKMMRTIKCQQKMMKHTFEIP